MNTDHAQPARGHRSVRAFAAGAAALAVCAALWDAVGALIAAPAWWPVPGYVGIGTAIAGGTLAVLVNLLLAPRSHRAPRLTGFRMLALGIMLCAWLLRGHHEIPADAPIVVAQLVAASALALAARLGRSRTVQARDINA